MRTARNNPLRYVDPDGRDAFDFVGGVITAYGSNLAWGANRPTPNNSDARWGQAVGDVLSIAAGGYEFVQGSGAVVGGALASESGVAVAVAGAGGAFAVHGLGVSASGLIHLAKNSGVYEFPDAQTPGRTYVGRSGNTGRRLKQHEKTGKKAAGAGTQTTEVQGGKTAREVAEQRRIDALGGTRDKPGSQLRTYGIRWVQHAAGKWTSTRAGEKSDAGRDCDPGQPSWTRRAQRQSPAGSEAQGRPARHSAINRAPLLGRRPDERRSPREEALWSPGTWFL